jgi:hypothetical protein
MRGTDQEQSHIFSYVSGGGVLKDHLGESAASLADDSLLKVTQR